MSPVDREETGDEEVTYNEEWIACALKQVELGMAVGEVLSGGGCMRLLRRGFTTAVSARW